MLPLHSRMTRVALRAIDSYGFCLAGGYAVQAHGFTDRQSDDVDLFTTMAQARHFPKAVRAVTKALADEGLTSEITRRFEMYARFQVTDPATGETTHLDLGTDWRARDPVALVIGPVLHPDDAVANKVSALYGRAEFRDFIDVHGALTDGRYSGDDLLRLGAEHEQGFDPAMFVSALRSVDRFGELAYRVYNLTNEQGAAIAGRMLAWADEIEARYRDRAG
ncbi:nucleotidyl transferase AbiEii/AbiGii toxin family protein [Dactylosporangium sp. NPDC048998]|uniref:nucleotidyl transferase AbiEii/AbiGii toxin family protein n=1 Tax=Dactylosporangium sp. NPDC048998 TaxID=3363976 RepID=UPI00371433B8